MPTELWQTRAVSAFPSTAQMSSLDHLPSLRPSLVAATFIEREDLSRTFASMRRVFVYQCDNIVADYRAAKKALAASTADTYSGGFFAFNDHMEAVALRVRKCYRLFDKLKGLPEVRLERIQKRLLEDGLKTILPIRDFVEHVDDRLHVDLEHGQPIMIRITADERGIEVARHTATFSALEAIIGRLHKVASALLEID